MTISAQAFAELSDALGRNNVSKDDGVRASYAMNGGLGNDIGPNKLSQFWPAAVVLPGSTEEVQAVVRICARHGVGFRAFSTGQATLTNREGAIYVDLRRMDKLHEIDERNQMAIIEPYVTVHRLQAEAMKKGLTCHIVGAGPGHSPLASATAFQGIGISGMTTGMNGRNLLAFEWVTPTGEIFRSGSAGSGAGWFAGEGPGPGFRGMIRGLIGTAGGLGIFTRIGYKLHPWAGPTAKGLVGQHPQLRMPVPEHFNVYQICWDDWNGPTAAAFDFKASKAINTLVRMPADFMGHMLTATNEEGVERRIAGTLPLIARNENRISWSVLTTGSSPAEAAYKDRVVRSIVEKTGGRILPLSLEEREMLLLCLVNSCYVHRVFRPANGMVTTMGVKDSFALLPKVIATTEKFFAEDTKPGGAFASTSPEGTWIWPTEGRHMWCENLPTFRSRNRPSYAAAVRYFLSIANYLNKRPIGVNAFVVGPLIDLYGPDYERANNWMRRIKNTFDPKNLSVGAMYIEPKMALNAKLWPLIRRLLFTRPLKALLKKATLDMVTKGPN